MKSSSVVELIQVNLAMGQKRIHAGLTLSVPAQGCTVLLGPSGTGKSTLLRMFAGLAQQHPLCQLSGQVRVQGLNEQGLAQADVPVLVGQKAELLLASVWENLVAWWPQRSRLTRLEQQATMQAHLLALGQDDVLAVCDKPVLDVPLGLRRRISILSKALAPTSLLMIDEPTVGLQEAECEALIALVRDLTKTLPVLVVTHHLGQARALADHVILVASGRVQEAAPAADFFHRPQSESAQQFLRSGSCPEIPLDESPDEPDMNDMTDVPIVDPMPPRSSTGESGGDAQGMCCIALPTAVLPAQEPASPVVQAQPFVRQQPGGVLKADTMAVATPAPTRPRGRGPRGFVWLMEGQLAGTPKPGLLADTEADLRALRDAGITHLLSLTEVPFPAQLAQAHGLSCSALPIPDMDAPSIDDAVSLCGWMDELLQAGHGIAVHCKAGLGRTGTVLAMYLLWRHKGLTQAVTAITKIRSLNAGMIQSVSQETFLERFRQHMERDVSQA